MHVLNGFAIPIDLPIVVALFSVVSVNHQLLLLVCVFLCVVFSESHLNLTSFQV